MDERRWVSISPAAEEPLMSGPEQRGNGPESLGPVEGKGSPVTHRLPWLAVLSAVTLRTILALQG